MSQEKDSLIEAVKRMQAILEATKTLIKDTGLLEASKEEAEKE